jgi:hypothetical protein
MGAVTYRQARSSRPASCDPGTILPIAGLHVLRHTAAKHRGVIGEATPKIDEALDLFEPEIEEHEGRATGPGGLRQLRTVAARARR